MLDPKKAAFCCTKESSFPVSQATEAVVGVYRHGAAQGYRDAGRAPDPTDPGGGGPSGGSTPAAAPGWAQSLARRQRVTQAGLVAAGALCEGDRPAGASGPDLKDKS